MVFLNYKINTMKKLLLSFLFLSITIIIYAQTKVTVIASGMTFTPANVTINVGDTVEWQNTSGFHNVNGTQSTFASNPEDFGNAVGSGWTYSHVFTTVGVNDYRCDVHFGSGMVGTVTVQTGTNVNLVDAEEEIKMYPNPTSKNLFFKGYKKINSVIIYSLSGEKIKEEILTSGKISVSDLESGVYFVKINNDDGVITRRLIIE